MFKQYTVNLTRPQAEALHEFLARLSLRDIVYLMGEPQKTGTAEQANRARRELVDSLAITFAEARERRRA